MSITPYLPIYRRSGIRITRGEGVYLIGDDGKPYLDFAAGIAVNAFGHCHPYLVEKLTAQSAALWHCSNQFITPQLEEFSARLVAATFADSVFFCSSGTEAVEAGIKFMRRYHYETGAPYRHRVITFDGGFHGRTYGGISAGGNESARVGFGQLLNGFDRVLLNDMEAVRRAVTKNTAGILIEPIQGEGGVQIATPEFLRELRTLCDAESLLLMCDEVQCGYGRPGTLFAFGRALRRISSRAQKGLAVVFRWARRWLPKKSAACYRPVVMAPLTAAIRSPWRWVMPCLISCSKKAALPM